MTTREWFRVLRRSFDALGPGDADYEHLFASLRRLDWRQAEFWWLLLRSRLTPLGRHLWTLSPDGYHWDCACGARVPSLEIGETAPSTTLFDPDCACPACQPCPLGPVRRSDGDPA